MGYVAFVYFIDITITQKLIVHEIKCKMSCSNYILTLVAFHHTYLVY